MSWNSKRQPTVALSSTEAEYMALSAATQEAMWLRQLNDEIFPAENEVAITLFCDNRSAIFLASNDVYKTRSKHIDIRHHFVRQKVADGKIKLQSISTENMTADVLTKAVPAIKQNYCSTKMGLH